MKKVCNRCHSKRWLTEYHKHSAHKDGLSNICVYCVRETQSKHRKTDKAKQTVAKYREKSKDKRNAYYREYSQTSKRKEYVRKYNQVAKLKLYYNLSEEKYIKLLELQDNKCKICNEELTKPNVDHCHKTGKVRGILCRGCNHGLGNFKDNTELLMKAKEYLDE